jgi:hypothetical protein
VNKNHLPAQFFVSGRVVLISE